MYTHIYIYVYIYIVPIGYSLLATNLAGPRSGAFQFLCFHRPKRPQDPHDGVAVGARDELVHDFRVCLSGAPTREKNYSAQVGY